jgi:hypothetical protein
MVSMCATACRKANRVFFRLSPAPQLIFVSATVFAQGKRRRLVCFTIFLVMSLRFNSSQNLLVRLQPLLLVCAHKLVKVLTLKAHLRHQLSLSRQTHEGFIKLWSMVSYDFTSKPFHRGSGSHPRVLISCL